MSSQLRVLHVVMKVQPTNGQFNEHCLPLMNEREITVCSLLPSTLECPSRIRMFEGDGTAVGGLRALWQALREPPPYDVIHVHSPQAGAALLPLVIRRRLIGRVVYTVQNSYKNYTARNRSLMLPVLAVYRQVVFCSTAAQETLPFSLQLARRLRRLAGGSDHVIPNSVDLLRIDRVVGQHVRRDDDRFRVVVPGRLMPIKNVSLVLEAVARSPYDNIDVVVVGDGVLRSELEEHAERLGLHERVTFTGMVDRDDVYRHVADADVCVSASFGEGLPVAVLEAMACGAPMVLSKILPHEEIARADPSSIPLFDPHDSDALARELGRLHQLRPDARRAIGTACRGVIEERYHLRSMHSAYLPVYAEAASTTDYSDPRSLDSLSR